MAPVTARGVLDIRSGREDGVKEHPIAICATITGSENRANQCFMGVEAACRDFEGPLERNKVKRGANVAIHNRVLGSTGLDLPVNRRRQTPRMPEPFRQIVPIRIVASSTNNANERFMRCSCAA
jgi:hypothetical protein